MTQADILKEFYQLLSDHALTSKALAEWMDEQYWHLTEGSGKDDETRSTIFLRETFYDAIAQWECLVANFRSTEIEFPKELIADWLSQVKQFLEAGGVEG